MNETVSGTISHFVEYTLEELKAMVQSSDYEVPIEINGKVVYKNTDANLLPGEVFRTYPNPERTSHGHCYEVSNFGRIRLNDKILEQNNDEPGYLKVHGKCVYRYVAETWCNPPANTKDWEVHHITNNGYDNRPANLIWVTEEMHQKIHN
jgi:hypothetical protein